VSSLANVKGAWCTKRRFYQALYVQGRGELRRELVKALRTGRARRNRTAGSMAVGRAASSIPG
jgi:hypothetical protein